MLNMPLVKIDSIGAGTGSFVRVNPNSGRPELGPDSAGARIGVCWPEGGLDTISVTDLNLVLGRVNPDYFLGGDVKLDPDRARAEVERAAREPLGLEVERRGRRGGRPVRADAEERGRRANPRARAIRRPTTRCSATAAAGPLHVAGYTEGVPYRDVLVPAWAAGFSAYGCACADFEYRYDQTIDMPIGAAGPGRAGEGGIGMMVTGAWLGLQEKVADGVRQVRNRARRIEFTHAVRMQYYGQLNDIEIVSPHMALAGARRRSTT